MAQPEQDRDPDRNREGEPDQRDQRVEPEHPAEQRDAGAEERRRALDRITAEIGESSSLSVLDGIEVVYVVRSPLQRWNDTISRILPSVQAVNTAQRVIP